MRYPGVVAHIGEYSLDERKVRHLEDVKVPMLYTVTSVAYDPDSETVFYAADNKAYRDLMAVDVNTGKARMLQHDARIGELVFNRSDRSLWGLRHLSGYVSLVRIEHPYDEWDLIHTFPYGTIVYDMDVSRDGELLSASFGDVEGQQSIRVFRIDDLRSGTVEPVTSFDFGLAIPEGFVFSPDARYLFGSAYYTGISNIFRYEVDTGELEAVSNTETGFFRPIPLDNENLIVFNYTGEGFVPAKIRAEPIDDIAAVTFLGTETIKKHPQLEDWQVRSDDDTPAESRVISRGEYVPIQNMRLESVYPIVLGYKDSVSLAVKANFSDPVLLDSSAAGAGYSVDGDLPSEERPNVMIDYRHSVIKNSPLAGTWRLGAWLNNADFYDLFGPTKQSRKGYAILRRLWKSADLRRTAAARVFHRAEPLRQHRRAPTLPGRARFHRQPDQLRRPARVLARAQLARRRRRRERHQVGPGDQRQLRGRRHDPEDRRQFRLRFCPAPEELVDLVPQRSRSCVRRRHGRVCELLFRRFRQ